MHVCSKTPRGSVPIARQSPSCVFALRAIGAETLNSIDARDDSRVCPAGRQIETPEPGRELARVRRCKFGKILKDLKNNGRKRDEDRAPTLFAKTTAEDRPAGSGAFPKISSAKGTKVDISMHEVTREKGQLARASSLRRRVVERHRFLTSFFFLFV